VISKGHVGASRQYLKHGCPSGLRKQIWRTFFTIDLSSHVSFRSPKILSTFLHFLTIK